MPFADVRTLMALAGERDQYFPRALGLVDEAAGLSEAGRCGLELLPNALLTAHPELAEPDAAFTRAARQTLLCQLWSDHDCRGMNARSIGRYTLGMPATTTKLTVSLPNDLLARADQLLVRPGEGRSSLITRVLSAAVRAAEEAAIDADYERAYPDDFTCSQEQQRTFAALERAQAEAMRAQLGIEGHG